MTNPTRYVVGTQVTMDASFLDEDGLPFDPTTVTAEVCLPTREVVDVSASVTHDSVGVYSFAYTPQVRGGYTYRILGTGNCQIAQQGQFIAELAYG